MRSAKAKSLFLFAVVFTSFGAAPATADSIVWTGWESEPFALAKNTGKLVLLDLEATWCHWCHVMDRETYSDPKVVRELAKHYITVKVDQDAQPDLSQRYRDWGWPATIIFDSNGNELAKRSGFIEPAEFTSLVKKLAENPIPESASELPDLTQATSSSLPKDLADGLLAKYYASFDAERGGLKTAHRFLDADTVELALRRSQLADGKRDLAIAQLTLDNNLKLVDPVWGGVFQYSSHRDWDHPHFEKIIPTQANNLRIYSMAFAATNDIRYHNAAQSVVRYLTEFLRGSDGAFFASQSADVADGVESAQYFAKSDSERRAIGVPRVDTNRYSRENGLVIEALATYYAVSHDAAALDQARMAASWVLANRQIDGGGFRHGQSDSGGPFLGDTLSMGRACLALYEVTAERSWLDCARAAGEFIEKRFLDVQGGNVLPGVISSAPNTSKLPVVRDIDENIVVARFAVRLFHYTGKDSARSLAELVLRYLSIPSVTQKHITDAGILLAADELSRDPLHITVVGSKNDKAAESLFLAALAQPGSYRRIEWLDTKEGPLPRGDIEYPKVGRSAAFICGNRRCSMPVFEPHGLAAVIAQFSKVSR